MRLWRHQRVDVGSYHDDSVLRIHRVAFWRWWWIWGVFVGPPTVLPPQVHSEEQELEYMRKHREAWPRGKKDCSNVYAEHHYAKPEHWAVIKRDREKRAKADK